MQAGRLVEIIPKPSRSNFGAGNTLDLFFEQQICVERARGRRRHIEDHSRHSRKVSGIILCIAPYFGGREYHAPMPCWVAI